MGTLKRNRSFGWRAATGSPYRGRRVALSVTAALGVGALAAACSSNGSASPASTGVSHATKTASANVVVATANLGTLGTVLVDGSGFALYHFTADGPGHPTCSGACASVWPSLTVPSGGKVVAGSGVNAMLLSTATRPDGTRQVTFGGLPLYRYRGDAKAGQTNGQGLGGTWFTVSPAAAAPTTTTSPSTTPPTTAASAPPSTAAPAPAPVPAAAPTAPPATSPPMTAAPPPPTTTTSPPPPATTAPPSGGGGGAGYGY